MMRPQLIPGLPQLWRDAHTLQFGVDPRRAVVLTGVDSAIVDVIAALDGRHNVADLTRCAERKGLPGAVLEELLHILTTSGTLLHCPPQSRLPARMPSTTRRRLTPDLSALALTTGDEAGPTLAQRAKRAVTIHGSGRIGPVIAALLAASGIGKVYFGGDGVASAHDACVGGLLPTDEDRPYRTAAEEAIRRAAPEIDTRPPSANQRSDLLILAATEAVAGLDTSPIPLGRMPHMPVLLRDGVAIIGPLVVPGHTACLGCLDRHRADRDPAWPVLAAQLATSHASVEPSHVAMATAAAAIAAMQGLCFLDGDSPEILGASLELTQLGGRLHRRRWQPHPACSCGAPVS